jgi:hypothetical protein
MVGRTTNLRTVDPLGLSTGGSRSNPLATSKPAMALKALFKALKPKSTPKVVRSQTNKGEVLLKRTGKRAALDLQLLGKTPPKKAGTPQPQSPPKSTTPPQTQGASPTNTQGVSAPQTPPPTTTAPQVKAAPTREQMADKVTGFQTQMKMQEQALAGLADQHHALFAAKKPDPDALGGYVANQRVAGAVIDGEIAKIKAAIKEAGGDPALAPQVARLKGLATEMAKQAILVQTPTLDVELPRANGRASLRDEVQPIEMMLDHFQGGLDRAPVLHNLSLAAPETMTDREVSLPELRGMIATFKRDVETDNPRLHRPTIDHLESLLEKLDIRLEVEGAARDLSALADRYPKLPLGDLVRQMRIGLPPIDWHGNLDNPAKMRIASGAIGALAGMLVDGEVLDLLIGTNGKLNDALLTVKVDAAKAQAVAHERAKGTALSPEQTKAAEGAGEKVAKLRHELTLANRTLEDNLKTDRQTWWKPSTWGDSGAVFGEGAASSVRKDRAFMEALAKRGGGDAGRDVLFLIARVSTLEADVIQLEQTVFGAHEGFDVDKIRRPFDNSSDPLHYLGLGNEDLGRIGIDPTERDEIRDALKGLIASAVVSMEQVEAATAQLNNGRKALRNDLVQDTLKDYADTSMQAVGTALLHDILVDAYLMTGSVKELGELGTITVKDGKVDAFFKVMAEGISLGAGKEGLGALRLSGQTYQEVEGRIAGLVGKRQALEAQLKDVTARIGSASAEGLGKAELAGLKGTKAALKEAIKAGDGAIASEGARLDAIMTARRNVLGPQVQEAQAMIRTAVLAAWTQTEKGEWRAPGAELVFKGGRLEQQLSPMAQRTQIEAMLKGWGLDIEAFAPEIDSALYGTIGVGDLRDWRSEIDFSSKFNRLKAESPDFRLLTTDHIMRRSDMDVAAKDAFRSLVEGMAPDDKLNLKIGQRITLDTLKIPVDPNGIAAMRFKLGVSMLDQLSIELGSDGFKLHVRTGHDVKGSGEAVVGKSFNVGAGKAYAEGSFGLEGSGGKLEGQTFKIPNTEIGRAKLVALLMKMADDEEIQPSDFLFTGDVADSMERNVKGGAFARARVGIEASIPVVGIGGGIVGETGVTAGAGYKWGAIDSINASTRSGETEFTTSFSIGATAYAKIQTLPNLAQGEAFKALGIQDAANDRFGEKDGKPKYDVSSPQQQVDLLGVTTTVTATYISKWKHERDSNGRYTKGEVVHQTNVGMPKAVTMLAVGTPEFRSRMASENPKDAEFQQKVASLMHLMGTDDVLSVTYAIDSAKMQLANDLLDEADNVRRGGNGKLADKREAEAEAIMSRADNHKPAKVALIKTNIDKREIGNLNMRFVRWDVISDSKYEHPTATVTL